MLYIIFMENATATKNFSYINCSFLLYLSICMNSFLVLFTHISKFYEDSFPVAMANNVFEILSSYTFSLICSADAVNVIAKIRFLTMT